VLPGSKTCIHDGHDICQWLRLSPDVRQSFEPLLGGFDEIKTGQQRLENELQRLSARIGVPQPLGRIIPPTIGRSFVDGDNRLNLFRAHFLTSTGERVSVVQPLAVVAIGGSGKSRAACEFAHSTAAVYSTQLFLSANSASILRQQVAGIALAIVQGASQLSEAVKIEVVLTQVPQLVSQGLLLIFDGVDDEETAQLLKEEFIPRLGSAHVVVTTRLRRWGRSIREVDLPSMPNSEAVRYLVESRIDGGTLQSDEIKAASDLASEFGSLPLALESAAAYLRAEGGSYNDYLALLRQNPAQPLKWRDGIELEYPQAFWKAFELTWERIKEKNPQALVILKVSAMYGPAPIPIAFWPETFSTPAVAEIAPSGTPDAETVPTEWNIATIMRFLNRYSQIEGWDKDQEQYSLHPVVRTILRASIPKEQLLHIIVSPLATLTDLSSGDVSNSHMWRRWEAIRPHVESVVVHAVEQHIVHPTTHLMSRLGNYLGARGAYDKAEALLRRAIEINESAWSNPKSEWYCLFEQPSVPSLHARHIASLAAILAQTDRLEEAERLLGRARNFVRDQAPDDPISATLTHDLGDVLARSSRPMEAESLFREALRIDEATLKPNDLDIARDYHSLGQLLIALGRFDEAESALCRAIRIDAVWRKRMPLDTFLSDKLFMDSPRSHPESWTKASPYSRKLTATWTKSIKKRLGCLHPALARDLTTLAALRTKQGRKNDATRLLERALGIYLYNWGPFHPTTEDTWEVLHHLTPLVRCDEDEANYNDWVTGMVLRELLHGSVPASSS
jgi:tetratricopeptide (TPR) repeat protein